MRRLELAFVSLAALASCMRDDATTVSTNEVTAPAAASVKSAATPKIEGLDRSACPNDARRAVRVLDASRCEVPRAVYFGENDCVRGRPKLTPVQGDGRIIGFRNESLGPHSVEALCGIRATDVWMRINGGSIATPEEALESGARLKSADKHVIELLRDAATITVEIRFVED